MFPSGNTNADLGYNKHNQYVAQPEHFLAAPGPGPVSVPCHGIANPIATTTPVLPMNAQGSIDWAQLAQQWIHMRDSSTVPPMANFSMNLPIAPPPPIISNAPEYQQHLQQQQIRQHQPNIRAHYEEHGEAEMDMDMDEEDNESLPRSTHAIENLPSPPMITQSSWTGGANNTSSINSATDTICSGTQQWNDWSTRTNPNPTAHIPSLLKLNVCNPNEPRLQQHTLQAMSRNTVANNSSGSGAVGTVSTEIDAKKRKLLPAWIREGLEKMEREKQRQLERHQPMGAELETPAINVTQVSTKSLTTPVNLLNISNLESDSEDSIVSDSEAIDAPNRAHLKGNDVLSKGSNCDDPEDDQANDQEQEKKQKDPSNADFVATVSKAGAANSKAATSGKNYEERLADLMLVVRRTLTEILLETTNEEIAAIATETLKAHRAKASSAQVIRKSALSSITGNLGLAVYGDSSSESEDDNAEDNEDGRSERGGDSSTDKTNDLSTDELKARIRKSKRAFEKVIDDIEERVLLQEQLDEQKLLHFRKLEMEKIEAARQHGESYRTDASVEESALDKTTASQSDKIQQFNGKRRRHRERTTRFSDNKDGKQAQNFVSQVVVVSPVKPAIVPEKLKPVANPATNLLQMPESMATMLHAADKALDKANKSSKKSKPKLRRSSSSSSSSSNSDSSNSSSSSDSDSSSNSSKSSSNSDGSSTHSSAPHKKRAKSRSRQSRGSSGHRQRNDSKTRKSRQRGPSTSSSQNYERHRDSRDRGCNRERDYGHDRRGILHGRQQQRRRRRQDSSQSGEDNSSNTSYRNSRHDSRSHQSSNRYGKHRRRTRSRSKSRSTHNSRSSVSTTTSASHHPQRHRK